MANEGFKGTGKYLGQVWDGRRWVPDPTYVPAVPDPNAPPPAGAIWNGQHWVAPTPPPPAARSTGRVIGGVVALVVAAIALLQGISWFSGFYELEADGNPFSGFLVILAMGAFVVAAGFGIWGIMLLQKPGR